MINLNLKVECDEDDWAEVKLLGMAHSQMHAYPPFSLWDRDERAEAGPATPKVL